MQRSVKARSDKIHPPPLGTQARFDSGMALYRQHCVQCHGAPGVAPEPFAFGLRPAPVNLVEPGRSWPPEEIYWIVKHGVKMTAMPGWQYRLTDDELWDLVAFVKRMPTLSPAEYRDSQSAVERVYLQSVAAPGPHEAAVGDPTAGLHAIYQYLCVTCHSIPGTVEGNPNVGPPLASIAGRRYLGGVLLNTPDNMVRWLLDPQAIDPKSAMPNLNIKEKDARDIAAYLYTLNKSP
jgi:mono/diheme cytochrome c family protein